MKLAQTRTLEATNVGDTLPRTKKTFTAADLVAYGSATWDWHRLHHDTNYAVARGFAQPVIDGQMYGAMFAQAIEDWVGPRGVIEKLSVSYLSVAFAGDALLLESSVSDTAREAGVGLITIEQTLTNGERLVSTAYSVVRIPLS
ncbi:MAG: MaoC/PaaZ C-terminal domain-containing protein [Gammaproteobacteria bacterium]